MFLMDFLRDSCGFGTRTSVAIGLPSRGAPELSFDASGDSTYDRLRQGRYCDVLSVNRDYVVDETFLASGWKALEQEMALVPAGTTWLNSAESSESAGLQAPARTPVSVDSFYIDRYAVTNRDFARFVACGGYTRCDYWPEDILPLVVQFVDSTGSPGPHYWSHGKPPENKLLHPVVGICWYEACAYAQWSGKRLPSSAEWQRAATWCQGERVGGDEPKYPWGETLEPTRANTWRSGRGDTVAVNEFAGGATANGVVQLIGNVWEWVADVFGGETLASGWRWVWREPLAQIRGGAFDTYFPAQATSQFRSGYPFLYRGNNVGFRCCVSAQHLVAPPDPAAFLAAR